MTKAGILDRKPNQLASILRDIFYDTGKTITEIFKSVANDKEEIDLEAFSFLVKKFATTFTESETQSLYKSLCPNRGERIKYNLFKQHFGWRIPEGNFEVEGLRRI